MIGTCIWTSETEEAEHTGNVTLQDIWTIIAWGAAALVLLVNAWEKGVAVWHALKAPDAAQNDRLLALESDMSKVKQYLDNDKKLIAGLMEGDKVTKRALLALLGHGIDGNNVDNMVEAKEKLETYLIEH